MHEDKKKALKELTEGMQRLCAVANRIVAQHGDASRIEVDLLLEDLRRLYDVALRLGGDKMPVAAPQAAPAGEHQPAPADEQRMMAMMSTMAAMATPAPAEEPAPQPAPAPVAKPEPVEPSPAEPEPAAPQSEPVPAPKPMPTMEELEHSDNALLFEEVVIEPEPASEPEPAPEPPAAHPAPQPAEPTPEPEPAPAAAAPKEEAKPEPAPHREHTGTQSSLLDYLQSTPQRTLGDQLAAQHPLQNTLERKVDDLRTVININDRFSFMSELFHNNIKAYNDFILALNATAERAAAMDMVAETAAAQKWDNESATVKTFYKILDKKF